MFVANASMEIFINQLLTSSPNNDVKKNVSVSYGFYGFGGVIGSFIVGIFGLNTLTLIGTLITIIGLLYINLSDLKSPSE